MGLGAHGQTLQEKLLRQSPKLSFNASVNYEGNFQDVETYQNFQSTSFLFSPRYRVSKDYTLIGRVGFSQGLTHETRSDLTNTTVAITRTPLKLGSFADVRPTFSLVLPTNGQQRNKDSLRGSLRFTANAFYKTLKNLILTTGVTTQLNNHEFTISAERGANIQAGYRRHRFLLDQSISYIRSAKLSFSVGHTNSGSVLTQDGLSSNVQLFDSRWSVFYLGALYNF